MWLTILATVLIGAGGARYVVQWLHDAADEEFQRNWERFITGRPDGEDQ